jgi:glycosyltransferase involved in cell wall biosynthesis
LKVIVVIPAHNEANHIAAVVSSVVAKGLEVVVIDDGSGDQTGFLARQSGATVLRNEPRGGKGFSLKRGFAHALEHGYDGVIAMDGDGQHDPDDLQNFLEAARGKSLCLVNGTRMGNTANMPFVRRMTNRLMSWMISKICGRRIEDTQCGYRYLSADLLRRIELTANDFEIETEMLLKSCRAECDVFSVPVKTIYRDEKSKINPIKDTIRFFSYLARDFKKKKS